VLNCRAWTSGAIDSVMARARQNTPYLRTWTFARYYAKNGNPDQAFDLLEQGFRDREAWMPFIQYDPAFASLRSDPRFQELVHRVAAAAGAI
jgi:hypothetical protein